MPTHQEVTKWYDTFGRMKLTMNDGVSWPKYLPFHKSEQEYSRLRLMDKAITLFNPLQQKNLHAFDEDYRDVWVLYASRCAWYQYTRTFGNWQNSFE